MRRIALLTCLGTLALTGTAGAAGLRAPALATPANGATVQQMPAITWNAVRGAATYEYQVAADPRFNSIVLGSGPGRGASRTHDLAAALEKTLADGTYYWRVRGLTAKDRPGPWSAVRRIVKHWTTAPVLTRGNGASVAWPKTPVVLEWTPVPYATKYIVTIATDPALSNIVLGSVSQPEETQGTNFAVPTSLDPGAYYWAITPLDTQGHRGVRSAVGTFTWSWSTATTTSVTDLNPDPRVFDPLFSWAPVPGAARYEVEVNSAQGFPPGSKWCCSTSTIGTSLAPPRVLANNRYYWRVRAIDAKGHAGVWNEGEPFTKQFDSVEPSITDLTVRNAQGGALSGVPATDTPIVTWDPVPGASRYEVQNVPHTPLGCDWSQVAFHPADQTETATTAWTPLAEAPHIGPTAWPRPQTTRPLPDGEGFLADTTAGSEVLTNVQGAGVAPGDEVAGPGIPEDTEVMKVTKSGESETITLSQPASATATQVILTDNPVQYCVRVLARSDDDAQGGQVVSPWTQINGFGQAAFTFLVRSQETEEKEAARASEEEEGAPSCPANSRPINEAGIWSRTTAYAKNDAVEEHHVTYISLADANIGHEPLSSPAFWRRAFVTPQCAYLLPGTGTLTPRTPLLTWKRLPEARGYYVVIARDAAFTEVADIGYTNVPAYAPRLANEAPLSDETTAYYWAVLPTLGAAGTGEFTVPQEDSPQWFNKSSTPPTPLAPASGSVISTQPTFKWTGAENARNYRFQVSQDPSFGHPLEDVTTDATAYTPATTYPADTVLYWRVRGNDWDGQGLNWSATETFVRTLPAPVLTALPASSGSSVPALSWQPVPGAIGYSVQTFEADGKSNTFTFESPSASVVKYYGTGIWRFQVRAEFPTGIAAGKVSGAASSNQSFLFTLPAPAGAQGVRSGSRLLVSWNPASWAKEYLVEVATAAGFAHRLESHHVQGTSWAPSIDRTLKMNRGPLYWRVAVVDWGGNVGTYASGSFGSARAACKRNPRTHRCVTRSRHKRHH